MVRIRIFLVVLLSSFGALAHGAVSLGFDATASNLGDVAVGLVSQRTLTLTNGGTDAATLQVTASAGDFNLAAPSTTCGGTLAGGASCTFGIRFAPTALGARSGILSVTSGALSSEATAALSGTGVPGDFSSTVAAVITGYYEKILGRSPDAGGMLFWQGEVSRMSGFGANASEVFYAMALAFFNSAEYSGRNTSDAQYLSDLYRTFFVREPDAGGMTFWQGQLKDGVPRLAVLNSFMFSAEFQAFMTGAFGTLTPGRAEVSAVIDYYRGLLGRLPDSGGIANWLGAFRVAQCQGAAAVNSQVDTISQQFIIGSEYYARDQGRPAAARTALYVADLYNAFLKRPVDLGGFQFWVGRIDSGAMTRDQLRAVFLASPEFQGKVAAIVAQGCLPPPVGSPPECSITANGSNPLATASPFVSVTLTGTCSNFPSSYVWTGIANPVAGPVQSMNLIASRTFGVSAINLSGTSGPASVTVSLNSPCNAYPNILPLTDLAWGSPASIHSRDRDGFPYNGIWVFRLPVSVGTPNSTAQGRVAVSEFQGLPTTRQMTISSLPCDFRATDFRGVAGPLTSSNGSTATIAFLAVPADQVGTTGTVADLVAGRTYFISVRNWSVDLNQGTGGVSCPVGSTCDAIFNYAPAGP